MWMTFRYLLRCVKIDQLRNHWTRNLIVKDLGRQQSLPLMESSYQKDTPYLKHNSSIKRLLKDYKATESKLISPPIDNSPEAKESMKISRIKLLQYIAALSTASYLLLEIAVNCICIRNIPRYNYGVDVSGIFNGC